MAVFDKKLHVQQVRTVGRKVIFNRLLVTNINEKPLEYATTAIVQQRDKHATLKHVLQYCNSLQANRFSARIGA
jgi:hypothetical protein